MGWHTGDDTWSGRRLARPALRSPLSATGTEIAERTAAGTGRSTVRRAEGDRRNEEEGTEEGGERGRSVSSLPQAAGARAQ